MESSPRSPEAVHGFNDDDRLAAVGFPLLAQGCVDELVRAGMEVGVAQVARQYFLSVFLSLDEQNPHRGHAHDGG